MTLGINRMTCKVLQIIMFLQDTLKPLPTAFQIVYLHEKAEIEYMDILRTLIYIRGKGINSRNCQRIL